MNDYEDDNDELPSKSAKKREMKALQELSRRLAGLPEATLDRFELADSTRAVIREIARMKPSGARNREMKYAAQHLAQEDLAAVHAWFEDSKARHAAENRHFHELERWRDRLVAEGDEALTELMTERPELDVQAIRQLMRTARREAEAGKPPAAARKLFKLLRGN